jgi:tetratricopeptide (TPR) repeat protein
VRTFVTLGCWLVVGWIGAAGTTAAADVIHLKSGDVIYADATKESDTRVEYEVGDNTYSIPKSRVEQVEKLAPVRRDAAVRASELPNYTASAPVVEDGQLLEQVIQSGQVNRSALTSIEARGNPQRTAVAYYIAGRQEFQDGKYNDARRDFESGLRNDPQNPAIVNFYAALLVKTGNAQDAITYAERAARMAPDSADALAVLGYAQFSANHTRDAIQSWTKSLALRPDASLQQLLERAKRENAAETNYSERETGHFVLRYEGKQSSDQFRGQILEVLESEYNQLASDFGGSPRASIQVVLYTTQAFFDVTRAPTWTGALNDGKLRIPLRGLESVTPDLARILKHELAHSFVNQLSMGRCPHWLNEGIAQMLEPRSVAPEGSRLAELFPDTKVVIGIGGTCHDPQEITRSYEQAHRTIETLRSKPNDRSNPS